MKKYILLITIIAVLLLVAPSSAWIAGYTGRQAVNLIGDASWTGNATDYQVRVYVYNANGVSSGSNIYLNGSGASFKNVGGTAIINDLRFTDTSDNVYSYWIEHTAANSSYWPVWVKVPTIYKNTSTQMYVYYGNSGATSVENMNNTFVVADDFDEGSLNTTTWSRNASQVTASLSSSVATISAPYCYGLYSNTHVPYGYEFRAYVSKEVSTTATEWGFSNASAVGGGEQGNYMLWLMNHDTSASAPVAVTPGSPSNNQYATGTAYYVYNIFRINSSHSIFMMTDGAYQLQASVFSYDKAGYTNNTSIWIGGDNSGKPLYIDWVMARQRLSVEPTVSIGNAGPTVDFTANTTRGPVPLSVQFTDMSYGSPTAYYWDFGDGSAQSFEQNPIHSFTTVGVFNVTLTATNANGTGYMTKASYITTTEANQTGFGSAYYPRTTTFHVQTAFGAPIVGATVTAQGMNTTASSWSWLYQILGISQAQTPIGTAVMTGTTDSNGDVQFLMLPTTQFTMSFQKAGEISVNMTVTPADEKYTVIGAWNVFGSTGNEDILAITTFSATNITINGSYQGIVVTGNDTRGHLTGGTLYINQTNVTPGGPEVTVYYQALPASNFSITVPVSNYKGKSYFVRINATQSDVGYIKHDYGIVFEKDQFDPAHLGDFTLFLISIGILMLAGMAFTATTAAKGTLFVCFIGWILYGIGWLRLGGTTMITALTLATVMGVAILMYEWRTTR